MYPDRTYSEVELEQITGTLEPLVSLLDSECQSKAANQFAGFIAEYQGITAGNGASASASAIPAHKVGAPRAPPAAPPAHAAWGSL